MNCIEITHDKVKIEGTMLNVLVDICFANFCSLIYIISAIDERSIIGNPRKDLDGLLHRRSTFGTLVVNACQPLPAAAARTKNGVATRHKDPRDRPLHADTANFCTWWDSFGLVFYCSTYQPKSIHPLSDQITFFLRMTPNYKLFQWIQEIIASR